MDHDHPKHCLSAKQLRDTFHELKYHEAYLEYPKPINSEFYLCLNYYVYKTFTTYLCC